MSGGREVIVVDGRGQILGRLASIVAKKLLEGKRVVVVNVQDVVVSGDPVMVVQSYKRTILGVRSHYSHRLRPKRPRSPIRLFKATVRGMLPKHNRRGREALKRLRAYIGVPKEYEGAEKVRFKEADASRLSRGYVTLGRIARELGWRGEVEA
ncbi:MAG: 50S ribosomal protein L13 [Desulfurococcales archaeon]|nr:50S ribosomal protein L13 [Desulfurococcales archaeon]